MQLNISLDGNGKVITDPAVISEDNPGNTIDFGVNVGDLTDFDDVYMNFTGVTRRGTEWRGSNMVYKALDQN